MDRSRRGTPILECQSAIGGKQSAHGRQQFPAFCRGYVMQHVAQDNQVERGRFRLGKVLCVLTTELHARSIAREKSTHLRGYVYGGDRPVGKRRGKALGQRSLAAADLQNVARFRDPGHDLAGKIIKVDKNTTVALRDGPFIGPETPADQRSKAKQFKVLRRAAPGRAEPAARQSWSNKDIGQYLGDRAGQGTKMPASTGPDCRRSPPPTRY